MNINEQIMEMMKTRSFVGSVYCTISPPEIRWQAVQAQFFSGKIMSRSGFGTDPDSAIVDCLKMEWKKPEETE